VPLPTSVPAALPCGMRSSRLFSLAIALGAVAAASTQLGQVLDGRGAGHAFAAFLVVWVVVAALLGFVVALLLRRANSRH
jgi:hypothetical protein